METTLEYPKQYSQKISFIPIILLVILFAACVYGTHAVIRHGEEAEAVRKCLENNDPLQTWVKPDGRVIYICRLPDGRFGVQVRDGIREITSYIKNKMSRLNQVEAWLHNIRAERIWYP